MTDLLNQYGDQMGATPPPMAMPPSMPMSTPDLSGGFPAIHIPQPFSLSNCDPVAIGKLRDEAMDKVRAWETALQPFFLEWQELSMNWRVQSRTKTGAKRPTGFHDSKSGETHRATETLSTVWFRMMTAADNFFEAVPKGLNPMGQELTPNDLYGIEKVLMTQLRTFHFKQKLLRSLRSLALFGTVIFEETWRQKIGYNGLAYAEGTDFEHRSLLQTGFDTTVYDIDMSDFIFTVDFPTVWRLREWARSSPDVWDKSKIAPFLENTEYSKNTNELKKGTTVFQRITERQQRAGYNVTDRNIRELISYHGKLDTNNSVIEQYWESEGRNDDPGDSDFTMGIIQGDEVVKFHMTQYRTWHSRFKTASFKDFELEPLAYGAGRIAKKTQRLIDVTDSRMDDILHFALYGMWKLGRFSGIKPSEFQIKPWNIIQLEDINQLEPLRPDMNAVVQALAMQMQRRDELRANTGATANLQAMDTKATATEATLTQSEAIRGAGVHAEIIAETMIREHLEQMHINNLDNLDAEIWVAISGEQKQRRYDKSNLPQNIGFELRIVSDKNFRPERIKKMLELIQICTSIRNLVPGSINAVPPLFEETFRELDMNPRLLTRPVPIADQLIDSVNRAKRMGQMGPAGMQDEQQAEVQGNASGGGHNISTPMGPVPTSPLGASPLSTGGM